MSLNEDQYNILTDLCLSYTGPADEIIYILKERAEDNNITFQEYLDILIVKDLLLE